MKTRRWFLRMLGLAPVTAPAAMEAAMAAPHPASAALLRLSSLVEGWLQVNMPAGFVLTDADFEVTRVPDHWKQGRIGRVYEVASPKAEPTHNTALACAATARQMRKQRH